MSESLRDQVESAYQTIVEKVETPAKDVSETIEPDKKEENIDTSVSNKPEAASIDDINPPEHWASEDKDLFKSVDRKAKEFLLKRHKEMEAAHTKKLQALSEDAKLAERFKGKLTPYKSYLDNLGADPLEAFEHLLKTEIRLRNASPQEKTALLHHLAKQYGAQLDPNYEPPQIDPVMQQVLERQQKTEAYLNQLAQEKELISRNNAKKQIQEFADAKDEKGNLKYPHFEKVKETMGSLIQAYLNTGHVPELAEVYEVAILKDKELRDQYVSQLSKPQVDKTLEAKRNEEVRQKTAASKEAGFNVGATGGDIRDTKKKLSLRAELARAYDSQRQ